MAQAEMPQTVIECAGCGKDLNLLMPYLHVMLRAKREVLISDEVPSEDPNEVPENEVYLGSKSGRGVVREFHNFDCLGMWVQEREGKEAKLEYHAEDEINQASAEGGGE
jgi:hypothetical protein